MNYGRFFVLDYKSSDIVNGIAVFNYRGVKYRKDDNRCECAADTPQYPIYLSINAQGVFFYVHYAIREEPGGGPEEKIIHQNSLILSLPVSSDFEIRDNLTRNLNEIYRVVFPVNQDGNYLYELFVDNVVSSEDQNKDITYSSLEVFGINYRKPANLKNPPMIGFLRKLFLDFLYDLEHTDVFGNSVFCEETCVKLRENFLFRAIANKAEYYYQRKQQTWAPVADYPWERADRDLFYADYYSKAEQTWVETIADPRANRCFYESEWFASVEAEMDRVYLPGICEDGLSGKCRTDARADRTKCCSQVLSSVRFRRELSREGQAREASRATIRSRVKDAARTASNWYIKKYSFSGTLKIWYGPNYGWGALLLLLLALAVGVSLAAPPHSVGGPVSDLITLAFAMIVVAGGILLVTAFGPQKRYLRTVGLVNVLMPRLFSSIVAGWFTLAVGEDIFKGFFDSIFDPYPAVLLSVILCVFVYYEISKLNPFLGFVRRMCRSAALLIIAFIYSFVVGFLVMAFFGEKYLERSDYVDKFYADNVFTAEPGFRVRNDCLNESVHRLFYDALARQDHALKHDICDICRKKKTLVDRIQGDSAVYDSIDSRLTFYLAERFFGEEAAGGVGPEEDVRSRVEHIRRHVEAIRNGADTTFAMTSFDDMTRRNVWAALLKRLDSQEAYRSSLDNLEPCDPATRHVILMRTVFGMGLFRDMLLQFTFFAMFIGIFIQLIFDEKPITEPV